MYAYKSLEYKEGYDAYGEGLSLVNNPYKQEADLYDDWQEGYFAAMEADED
jgi:hypothetical protein